MTRPVWMEAWIQQKDDELVGVTTEGEDPEESAAQRVAAYLEGQRVAWQRRHHAQAALYQPYLLAQMHSQALVDQQHVFVLQLQRNLDSSQQAYAGMMGGLLGGLSR